MNARVLAVAACCAALVGGCGDDAGGGGSGGDDADAIRAVVADYATGLVEGDARRACGALSPAALKQLSGRGNRAGCLALVRERGRPSGRERRQLEDPEVQDLEIEGDRASALVRIEGSRSEARTRFRKVDGDWLIDGQS